MKYWKLTIIFVGMLYCSRGFSENMAEIPVVMVAKLIMMKSPGADIESQILERSTTFREEVDVEIPLTKLRWCLADKGIQTDLIYLAQHADNNDGLLNELLLDAVRYRQHSIIDALLANQHVDVNYHDQNGYSVISLSSQDPQLLKKLLDHPRVSRQTIERSSIVRRASDNAESLRILFGHPRISNAVINDMPLPGMSVLFNLLKPDFVKKKLSEYQVETFILGLIKSERLKRETVIARNAFGENILFFADKSLPVLQALLENHAWFMSQDVNLRNYQGETLLHAYLQYDDFSRAYEAIKIVLNCDRFDKRLVLHKSNKMTPREKLESIEKALQERGVVLSEMDTLAIKKIKEVLAFIEQIVIKKSRL